MKKILLFTFLWTYLLIGAGAVYRAGIQHPEKSDLGVFVMVIAWPISIGVILMDLEYKSNERINDGYSRPSRAA